MKRSTILIGGVCVVCLAVLGYFSFRTPQSAEARLANAAQRIEAQDYTAAEKQLQGVTGHLEERAAQYRSILEGYRTKGAQDGLLRVYEQLYPLGLCTATELRELGTLALSAERPALARDALEQAYRLAPDEETLTQLDGLVVDAQADTQDVSQRIDALYRLLQDHDADGVVAAVLEDGWFDALKPRSSAGTRKYRYALQGAAPQLKLEVGYSANGSATTRLWFTEEDGAVTFVRRDANLLTVAQLHAANGGYTGAFEVQTCQASTGQVYVDSGTLSNGVLTGAYTAQVSASEAPATLSALWAGRNERAKTAFTGAFDDTGHATAAQQTAGAGQGAVVYAYDEATQNYLYVPGQAAQDHVFTPQLFLVDDIPAW